jgi:hypothetical protein
LDPARLVDYIALLAMNEIQTLLEQNICLENERQFFENVLQNLKAQESLVQVFRQHTRDIETKYHNDTAGQFELLWPELEKLHKQEY